MRDESAWFEEASRQYDDDPEIVLYEILLDLTEKMAKTMEDRDISQAELSDRLGISRQCVNRFMNTHSNTTLKTLIKFALALDMDLEITLHDEPKTKEQKASQEWRQLKAPEPASPADLWGKKGKKAVQLPCKQEDGDDGERATAA